MISDEAKAFAIGVATGVLLVGITAYVVAPVVAGRAAEVAVNRQGSRVLGLPETLLAPLGRHIGAMVREETARQLTPW